MTTWLLVGIALQGCKKDGIVVEDTDDTGLIGVVVPGDPCTTGEDCGNNLVCASDLTCREPGDPGTTPFGESCVLSNECQAGLVCDANNTCVGAGGPGTGERGDACTSTDDCQSTLSCFEETCVGLPYAPVAPLECPDEEQPPFRIRFEVPRGAASGPDFFTLPFPNDIRTTSGSLDLSGFPAGPDFAGYGDQVSPVLDQLSDDFSGFGPMQPVYFRFSGLANFDTVIVGLPSEEGASVSIVDITPDSPSYGVRHPTGWKVTTGLPYLCDYWIQLYPSAGRPMRPGNTYAAVITTDLLGDANEVPVQDPDFAAMLGGPPADGSLQTAWEAYAPLRDWIASEGLDGADLAAAAVFTVADTSDAAERTWTNVQGAAIPAPADLILCDGVPGPHADPLDPSRGCEDADPAFHEVQGALAVPHIQSGSAPFKLPSDGGAADWSTGGPQIGATEDVTFAVSIPKNTPMPAEGWPVVLYAHDHLGNYRAFVSEGVAAQLAGVGLDDGSTVGFAVISIDTWLTGPRKGEVDADWLSLDPAADDPILLYNNPLNPVAARDNLAQSTVDWMSVVRFLQNVDWSDASSPTGEPVVFDTDHIYFVGHGIGAAAGPTLLARDPAVLGGVLANSGAWWTEIVAGTEAPISMASYPASAWGDAAIDRFQPVLQLGQGVVDRTDPVNQARFVHFDQSSDNADVLQIAVPSDPTISAGAQQTLARAMYLQQNVGPGALALEDLDEVGLPVSDNVNGATAVTLVREPAAGADPHRVFFEDADVRDAVSGFLGTAVRDGTPTVP